MTPDGTEDLEDQLAAQAEALDQALAAGEVPSLISRDLESNEAFSVLLSAHTALQALERVWPRGTPQKQELHGNESDGEPKSFGRFRVIRELGRGGFGVVFLAVDPELNRPVALKLPLADSLLSADIRRRFVREAQAAAVLDHPNLVPLYEAGEIDSICYLASAFCDGPTLSAWLRDQPSAVSPSVAARMVADMADAVQHSHDRGVLHRDLKPSNVIMDMGLAEHSSNRVSRSRSSSTPVPRIADFGLARLMDRPGDEMTASFTAMGSAAYMAPEQAEGKKVGAAADIYSLGAILYVLLCNRPPHQGANDLVTLRRAVTDEPAPPRSLRRDVPRDLEAICLRCLQKDASRRYPSARELSQDLDRFLAGEPTRARPAGCWETFQRRAAQKPGFLAVLAIAATFALLAVATQRFYQTRLDNVRQLAQLQAEQALAKTKAQQAYLDYGRKLRQADELLRNLKGAPPLQILESLRPGPDGRDLREFAWYHLRSRCETQRRTLKAHRGDVYFLCYSPRGDLLASAGKDGSVCIWSAANWSLLRQFTASKKEVNVCAFAPDGRALATVDDEGKLKVWETATAHQLMETKAHPDDAVTALFTKDGTTIITGGRNDGLIKFWNRDGVEEGRIITGTKTLEGAALSSDGSILATGGTAGVQLWDVRTKTRRALLSRAEGAQTVAFSHDGTRLVAAFESGRLIAWDVATGAIAREYSGSYTGAYGAVLSSDDKTISCSDNDGVIRHWDTHSGQSRGTGLGHVGRIWNLAVSPGGGTIASAGKDGTVRIWDTKVSREFFKLGQSWQGPVGFTDGGKTVLALDGNKVWSIERWNARTGSFLRRTAHQLRTKAVLQPILERRHRAADRR